MKGWLHGGAGNDKAAVLRGQPPYFSGYHDGNDLGPWPGTGTAVEPDANVILFNRIEPPCREPALVVVPQPSPRLLAGWGYLVHLHLDAPFVGPVAYRFRGTPILL